MMRDDLRLVNHETSMAALQAVMARVGATHMTPGAFISAVSNTFHRYEVKNYQQVRHDLFKKSGSSQDLREAFSRCQALVQPPISALNIGGGAGYDGSVLAEVFEKTQIDLFIHSDISPEMSKAARVNLKDRFNKIDFLVGSVFELLPDPVDLIITHSLIHHIPDLFAFFEALDARLRPSGLYVMGHEPSSRFWANPECKMNHDRMRAEEKTRKQLQRFTDPRRLVMKVYRMVHPAGPTRVEKINRTLKEQYHFTGNLTWREINKLVDIHIPSRAPGDFSIGYDWGFDWEEIQQTFLVNYEIVWVGTSDYMGGKNPFTLSKRWQEVNANLSKKYPLDGATFTVLFQKKANRTP